MTEIKRWARNSRNLVWSFDADRMVCPNTGMFSNFGRHNFVFTGVKPPWERDDYPSKDTGETRCTNIAQCNRERRDDAK